MTLMASLGHPLNIPRTSRPTPTPDKTPPEARRTAPGTIQDPAKTPQLNQVNFETL